LEDTINLFRRKLWIRWNRVFILNPKQTRFEITLWGKTHPKGFLVEEVYSRI